LYLLSPIVFLRFGIGWGAVMILSFFIKLVIINHNTGDPLPEWKAKLITFSCKITARIVFFMMSVLYIND